MRKWVIPIAIAIASTHGAGAADTGNSSCAAHIDYLQNVYNIVNSQFNAGQAAAADVQYALFMLTQAQYDCGTINITAFCQTAPPAIMNYRDDALSIYRTGRGEITNVLNSEKQYWIAKGKCL
jgi:hypothetical protein